MKKIIFFLGAILPMTVFGQNTLLSTQSNNDSLIKPLLNPEKVQLFNNVDLLFITRIANDNYFTDGTFQNSQFNNNQFRIELKGNITDKVYFRFRNRLTSAGTVGTEDRTSHTVDYALVGVSLSESTTLNFGKISAAWGGWEFDMNPIDILEYNDILENAGNYLTGVGLTYRLNENHSFTGQILNSSNDKFEVQYKGMIPEGVKTSKVPFAYIANWYGKFWDGKFETTYSYSYFTEAKGRGMNFWSFGNKFENAKWKVMYDFKYSNEGLDSKGIVTNILDTGVAAQQVSYLEHWIRSEFRMNEKLGMSLTLMSSKAFKKNEISNDSGSDLLRTSYGVIPEFSYYPFKNQDIRFYASYVGRWYDYSNFSKEQLGSVNSNTGRVSIGFIAPLFIF